MSDAAEEISKEECRRQTDIFRSYWENKFPIWEPPEIDLSVTAPAPPGNTICLDGYCTAEDARIAAQEQFEKYIQGKSGILCWRVVPKIFQYADREDYGFSMRLLILGSNWNG
jgi:hypothetical protein